MRWRFLPAAALLAVPPGFGAAVTFSRDIAPIVYQHCSGCHHTGDIAPFPLIDYRDVAKRARQIAAVTSARTMPPWKPVHGYGGFAGERRLSDLQIALFERWAAAGAPEGDPARLPPEPRFPSDWRLGKPDLVVTLPKPYTVPADGRDQYRCFAIPTGLARDRYVRAFEIRPSNRRVVHHALVFTDTTGIGRRKAASSPGQGYSCFGSIGFLPTSALGGWTPGAGPVTEPDGIAATVRRGADLIVQLHFHPTGKPEREQSSIALYFTDRAPRKSLADIPLGSRRIDIPPGDAHYTVTDRFTLPVDVDAVGIIPHAHYICRQMLGIAELPGGSKKDLIWIKDWDFNWQEQYRYASPIRLPADTVLKMEFVYDNSAANPRNPNSPPKRVVWGAGITDEMAGLHIAVIPVHEEDAHELGQALWGKTMREVGGRFFRLPGER